MSEYKSQEPKAEKQSILFLDTWKSGDFKELYKLAQKSWRSKHKRSLFQWIKYFIFLTGSPKWMKLTLFQIESYRIDKIKFVSLVIFDLIVTLKIKDQYKAEKYRIRFVSEKKPYIADPNADFGFNPISVRKQLHIKR